MAGRIEDYALIGDLETAALVGTDGAIDWLCVPRFDSPACFAALLGTEANGQWRMGPARRGRCNRRSYRGDSLVLDSVWDTATGAVRVTDFMPPRSDFPQLVRIVEGLSGHVEMTGELRLRFDNGRIVPWAQQLDAHRIRCAVGPDSAYLLSEPGVRVSVDDRLVTTSFTVTAGQRLCFALCWSPSHIEQQTAQAPQALLDRTLAFWQEWTSKCLYTGPWREAVVRSLITLKALTYAPTGGIVAAATTSLPETLGGQRNWDYRFCWLRDATFTLSCLMRSGYAEEAAAWNDWLVRTVGGDPSDLQPVYGVGGHRRLPEEELTWLSGYADSRPVRAGNAAAHQLQLDIYGEVLNTFYSAMRAGVPIDGRVRELIASFLGFLEKHWRDPDEGLWEVRGPQRHFVHSKVMAWVAADRALRMARVTGLRYLEGRWRAMRAEIRADVLSHGWDPEQRTFVQYYGSNGVDASALLLPKLGFVAPAGRMALGTIEAMHRLERNGFLQRYEPANGNGPAVHGVDGVTGGEATFLACTLWLADALCLAGRTAEARDVFERVLAVRNDVGLLAEEWDPAAGRQLGNVPQAFSHVAVVNTAFMLNDARGRRRPADGRAAPVHERW
ncbi:glycoside hydrolase family 15 protein [Streptomyces sp. NPDC086023]|uniref:glycoside hydrolase family 15 protein n=1 Tax=Streptomyces sp. NPDC086023 TaxID=3365746 RepID=UPI0037D1AE51